MKVAYIGPVVQTRAILCHFAAQNQLKITKFHRRYGAGELLHSRPQESTEFLSIHFM